MIKLAYCQKQIGYRTAPSPYEMRSVTDLVKIARNAQFERIAINPSSHYYLDSWAVSAYERFGLNENSDGFERDQLKKAHRTFVGSWVCLDHENWDEALSVGTNVDAIFMPDDYVRVAMAVDRERSEQRRPGLEQRIASGQVTDTSMGVYASSSLCTIPLCANEAFDETQFCEHVLPPFRGTVLCNRLTDYKPVKCGELNRGLHFFENTIITFDEGADRNAKIIEKLAAVSRQGGARGREVNAILQAIRDVAQDAGPAGVAVLARLVHRLHEVIA